MERFGLLKISRREAGHFSAQRMSQLLHDKKLKEWSEKLMGQIRSFRFDRNNSLYHTWE